MIIDGLGEAINSEQEQAQASTPGTCAAHRTGVQAPCPRLASSGLSRLNLVCPDVNHIIDNAREAVAALVEFRRVRIVAGINSGAAGQQRVRGCWTAVVL